jgi:O-antigen ligase
MTDLAMKVLPIATLVAVAAYIAAQQAISPQRRVIKVAVLLGLLALMLRFDLVYSVYLFALLFSFPSDVSIGSSNSILMTLIPLIWAVRASSAKVKLFFRKTNADFAIALYLFAYVLSFINVETTEELKSSLKVMWMMVTAVVFFYTIVTFVDDEKKVITLVKVSCAVCGFVMLTAVLELFMPGRALIPGWIGFGGRSGIGELGYRVEGMRVGGALKSHGMASDFGTRSLFLLMFLLVKVRNPFERLVWGGVTLVTVVAVVATANRGAFFSFVIGLLVLWYLFRKQISVARMTIVLGAVAALFVVSEIALTRFTNATSLSARIMATEFSGGVPDTRKNTWKPALVKGLEHPFVGHGPYYDIGEGLAKQMWPHNSFLFLFYTVGVFGLLAFLAVLYHVWGYSLSFRLPNVRGSTLADLSKILCTILVVTVLQQMRTDFQRGSVYPYMIWMIFGLITATGLLLRDQSANKPPPPPETHGGGGVFRGNARRVRRPRRGRL